MDESGIVLFLGLISFMLVKTVSSFKLKTEKVNKRDLNGSSSLITHFAHAHL